ncbi:hypothetical protein HWV62_23260 [Athelia sp. TMB]|nr:hypothetical protein HWV62_23260 [Athelia sp. TMB]
MAYPSIAIQSLSEADKCIIIMGVTGAGKSTFVAHAAGRFSSDDDGLIGHELLSCTSEIYATRIQNRPNGDNVVLVDTPGFDDTETPDVMILKKIADWLAATGKQGIKLAGVIYLHRISDNRLNNAKMVNLKMLKSMCGADAMPNVALVSTMWSCAGSKFLSRETELRSTFWKDMITNGAAYRRFEDSTQSAWDIITPLLALETVELSFQQEISNGCSVPETQAGRSARQSPSRMTSLGQPTSESTTLAYAQVKSQIASYVSGFDSWTTSNKWND